MADRLPEFETEDNDQIVEQYSGSVGTTAIQIPSSPLTDLLSISITNSVENIPNTKRLQYSLDGSVFHNLSYQESITTIIGKNSSGNPRKQVFIKGSVAGVLYEILLKRALS